MKTTSSKKSTNPLTASQASTGLWVIFVILIILFSVVVGFYITDRNNRIADGEQYTVTEAEVLQQQIDDLEKDIIALENKNANGATTETTMKGEDSDTTNVYKSESGKFSVTLPKPWAALGDESAFSDTNGESIYGFGPDGVRETGENAAHWTIAVYPTTLNTTKEKEIQTFKTGYQKNGYTIISEESMTMNGIKSTKISTNADGKDYVDIFFQASNGIVYIVSGNIDRYAKEFEQFYKSFTAL